MTLPETIRDQIKQETGLSISVSRKSKGAKRDFVVFSIRKQEGLKKQFSNEWLTGFMANFKRSYADQNVIEIHKSNL
jgi:hypothetical protein